MTSAFVAPEVDWAALLPVLLVLGAGVVGVLAEAFVPRPHRRPVQLTLTLVALAAALVSIAWLWTQVRVDGGIAVLGGSMLVDGVTLAIQGVVAVVALVALLVLADRADGEVHFAPSAAAVPGSEYEELARRKGLQQTEVYPLVLFATGGMLLFPAAGDLLTLFIALEVLSLPLYLLSGMARRRRLLSQEAAMKYFLLGAFSSGFVIYGIALVYGFAGSVRFSDIAAAIAGVVGLDVLLVAGLLLILVGLLFKVGAVPFHSWTPDVYQGAPTAVTGFMAACTKVAAFGAMLRLVYVVLPPLEWELMPALWAVAVVTMLVGTVLAIVQSDMKRMLAYSSVAHAGFVLVGVVALTQSGIGSTVFYLLGYGLATVGAFAIVSLVREQGAEGAMLAEATHMSQWAGLGQRHPWLAASFALFLLSFAGIPLTAGFAGKFAVFAAAIEGGLTWLVVVGVLASAAAVFFYVRVIVLMFFTETVGTAGTTTVVARTDGLTAVAIGIGVAGTVLLGVLPSPVLDVLREASVLIP